MEAPSVQYVRTGDGYSIAYTVSGEGAPLVFLPAGITHLQLVRRHDRRIGPWLDHISRHFRLVQYDSRGQGMSQRDVAPGQTMADLEIDLEAVVDELGLDRFILAGYFYNGHVAVRYTVKHPERVRALVLISCSVSMDAWPLGSLVGLAERNWEGMLQNWVPATFTPAERDELIDYFKRARHQADWVTSARAFSVSDIGDALPRVQAPTLVLHPRDFIWLPAEESMKTAAAIKGARFALLDGVLPMGDPVQGLPILQNFVAGLQDEPKTATAPGSGRDGLSPRELEVLRLLAAGKSNQQIADELVISLNTVRRHVSNLFDKTGVANRAQAAIYARDHGLI